MTIHIRNFKKYQHRDCIRSGSAMEWIKDFTGQLSDDDWLNLTFAQRGLLQSLRLEYGRSVKKGDEDTPSIFRGLTEDPARLGRRLGQRVMRNDLQQLKDKGFIQFLPADDQQQASPEEIRGEESRTTNLYVVPQQDARTHGLDADVEAPVGDVGEAGTGTVEHPDVPGWQRPPDAGDVLEFLAGRRAMPP